MTFICLSNQLIFILNKLKTNFLSLVSHEFKTPLSGILTSIILLGKYNLAEQQEKREERGQYFLHYFERHFEAKQIQRQLLHLLEELQNND